VTAFLGSNLIIGLVLIALLLALVWRQRHHLDVPFTSPQRSWRALAWLGFAATAALTLWGTFADNWRKMVGEALDINEKYLSQRLVLEPVARDVRAVTLALLALSLLGMAPLFARYIGGYGYQLLLVLAGGTLFFPGFFLRQRLDTVLVSTLLFDLPPPLSLGMLSTIIFVVLDYAANVALLVISYLGLLGLVALPVTLVLDLLRQREPPADRQTAAYYAELRANLAARRAMTPQGVDAVPGGPPAAAEPGRDDRREPHPRP
jgi:hypothetical protein